MRPMRLLSPAVGIVLVVGATAPAATAEPAEVRWESSIAAGSILSEATALAVSPDRTTAYAAGSSRADVQATSSTASVHAVDVATGTTRWSTDLQPDLAIHRVAVDPTTGQVVIGGTAPVDARSQAVVTAFSPAGDQVWTSSTPGHVLHDLAVDATGRVCAASSTGSGGTWRTQCWSAAGQAQFVRDFRARSNSWPRAIEVDDATGRVFVVGPRTRRSRSLVTTLAYTAEGRTAWQRSTEVDDRYPSVADVALDPGTNRLYVLVDVDRRASVIAQRTTDGTNAYRRTFGSGRSRTPRPFAITVLPRSHRVVVTSHAKPRYRGTVRHLDRRGRQVALARFRECCDLTRPVVDPATDRLSLAWGPGTFDDGLPLEDEGVGAATWDRRGHKVRNLDLSLSGPVRAVAALASAGDDLLVLGDRLPSGTDPQKGSFLVAVR